MIFSSNLRGDFSPIKEAVTQRTKKVRKEQPTKSGGNIDRKVLGKITLNRLFPNFNAFALFLQEILQVKYALFQERGWQGFRAYRLPKLLLYVATKYRLRHTPQ